MIRRKTLNGAKVLKKWLVIVDGTELDEGFEKKNDNYLERCYNRGTSEEYIRYHRSVLKGKYIWYLGNNLIATEPIENDPEEGIYEKLYSQIKNAKDIASPFLKETQVNNVKIKLLEATRKNSNLRIKILYGIKDTRESGKLINPVQLNKSHYYINELKNILGYKLLVQETNTHIKLIIFDDDSFILGSTNVLSFSGTYNENPNMHSEVAIFSLDKELLKELKNKYFNWQITIFV
ncbi:hypothetical protein ACTNDG_12940 [Clostridium sp. HCP1S3_B4]|uniref:hypothetical protein n=1 Tax=unclassified Clostridium TaxID=2614128 RepID=UPI003F88E86E